ncbi:MAG: helix-hairpin-helix domain-containing protein, partial [Desulfomonilia bacterium]|nr:helix-hairpin-helix domain-containing protein [Desulfomonilia bacterium]
LGGRFYHLHGKNDKAEAVRKLISWYKKRSPRLFTIGLGDSPNDFSMLKEVMERRLGSDEPKPDLIILDGGKGQLEVCLRAFREMDIPSIPVIAMAKARGKKPDRFFVPGRKNPVLLPERSGSLRTLRMIRDEAHRFAIRYHRLLRRRATKSLFEEIPGIGPKKATALLKTLGRIKDLSQCSAQDLEHIPGLTEADRIAVLSLLKGFTPGLSEHEQ